MVSKTEGPNNNEDSDIEIMLPEEKPSDVLTDARPSQPSLGIDAGVKSHNDVEGETHGTDQS